VDVLKILITSYILLNLLHIVLVHPEQTSSDYIDLAQTHWKKCQRMLQLEQDQRSRLEETVEQLARQLGGLEQAAKEHSIPVRDRGSECFRHSGGEGDIVISGL
jgi:septal ring factor EnvC (AmiA/AmiB activator)